MEKDYMEILLEEMRSQFDLVLEGHAVLYARIGTVSREWNEKFDLTEFSIKILASEVSSLREEFNAFRHEINGKVDSVASNLAAHRTDTEAHSRYQIRE